MLHMIEKNVVRIRTLEGMGTGLIYPCYKDGRHGYIIFTNRHVLIEVEEETPIEEQVELKIYDDFGKEIKKEQMKNWDHYFEPKIPSGADDIAAIYLELEEDVVFHVETAVELQELENRKTIYMEGYPGVMSNDDINQRIQLEGISKTIFPGNNEIGVYQITDDYHWYNNYNDHKILKGISGSPVYYEKQGKKYLLGINQSVSNIENGENPFKLVYYIKWMCILEYLRDRDCIIFHRTSESEFEIHWVKDKKDFVGNEIKLMLIGGSGAGKSSFIKELVYHQNKIKSVGDGQTTRSDVCYSFTRVNQKPTATVDFMSRDEFRKRMYEKIGTYPIRLTIAQTLHINKNVVEDEKTFLFQLHNIYEILSEQEKMDLSIEQKQSGISHENENEMKTESIKKQGKFSSVLEQIDRLLFHTESEKDPIMVYEKILDHILDWVPYYFFPCILDKDWGKQHKIKEKMENDEIMELFSISDLSYGQDIRNIWKEISNEVYLILRKYVKNKFETLQKQLVLYFYKLYLNRSFTRRSYEKNSFLNEYQIKTNSNWIKIHGLSHVEFKKNLSIPIFENQLFESITKIEGFFELQEFDFLLGHHWEQELKEKIEIVRYRVRMVEDEEQEERRNRTYDVDISVGIKELYGTMYQKIIDAMKEKQKERIQKEETELKILFELQNMDEAEILLLQKCLKVTREGSLAGIVKNVTIEDKISNTYALILDKLKIHKLTIIDTCGLDHVTVWDEKKMEKQVERLYSEYVKKWKSGVVGENIMQETGILYIKKLDSGRPDELRSVLPMVRKIMPATPIYCVFSGIDIFYRTEQEVEHINWSCSVQDVPKAVGYIMENDMGMTEETDANIYQVMKNNIIPFCGNEKILNAKFAYEKNNYEGVRRLLTSIAMKEASSLELIEQDFINEVQQGVKDNAIEDLLRIIFEKSSLHSSAVWYNTKKADIRSFFRNKKMGYNNTHNHFVSFLFHMGYAAAIRERGDVFFEAHDDVKYAAAVKSCLYNMENAFLGINDNLIDTELDSNEKNEFRKQLEEMYKKIEYNPFDGSFEQKVVENLETNRDEIFDQIFDFSKLLEGESLEKLREFFKNQFILQMNVDNARKVSYLVRTNEDLMKALDKVKHEFMRKYGEQNKVGEEMFNMFMMYYFASGKGNSPQK